MKCVIYTNRAGTLCVLRPAEGARLARSVRLATDEILSAEEPTPVERFLRGWPVVGAEVEWAETEDEFVERILEKDVPADALAPRIVAEEDLPADKTYRGAWLDTGRAIIVDAERAKLIDAGRIRDQLDALDEASGTTRPVREFVLGALQVFTSLRSTTNPTLPDLSTQPGLVRCQEVEQQATILRDELGALG